jgi:hypothetical protein
MATVDTSSSLVDKFRNLIPYRRTSYGIAFWYRDSAGAWMGIFQVSCHWKTQEWKVDLFRGRAERDEHPRLTAARETAEESVLVFNIPKVPRSCRGGFHDRIFNVVVQLEPGETFDVATLNAMMTRNRKLPQCQGACWQETHSIVCVPLTSEREFQFEGRPIRIGTHCRSILRHAAAAVESFPIMRLRRDGDSYELAP